MKDSKNKYKIPNCTPNQLVKFLRALEAGETNQHLVNVLVMDKDAHHQGNMAIRLGLAKKSERRYMLTKLGKHIVPLIGTDEFAEIFREKCIPKVPIFRDMQRVVKLADEMKKEDFKENIGNLVNDPEWSPITLDQYANLIIGYFKLCGLVEYHRSQKIVRYIR